MAGPSGTVDPLLFGANADEGLVAVEHLPGRGGPDAMALFVRRGPATEVVREPFRPFIAVERRWLEGCPVEHEAQPLDGGAPLDTLARFVTWKACDAARAWLAQRTGATPSASGAPYLFLADPVQQHLMATGRTCFKGLAFEDLRRLQVDIECVTTPGFSFCNAEREGDRIVAIALTDQTGWTEVLSGVDRDERALLDAFVRLVRERDPDVIEGHNLFNFDLPYIAARAQRHGVKLALGRDGSVPRQRPSRFSAGERTLAYTRVDIHGRHVVDTLFLVHAYDIAHRSLDGFGLKSVAVHFGVAAPDRTYIEGAEIAAAFQDDPARLLRYVRDDVVETREVSRVLSRSYFVQAQMLPMSYQNACVRGTATKIDALMLREYLRQGRALPLPDAPRPFAGGYTDVFATGVIANVHHVDVRSLYPSLMLARGLAPASDGLGVFLRMLAALRTFRLEAKRAMQAARTEAERARCDALQATFKVLINSFYGYLGFAQARFSDFAAAAAVAENGRALLADMIAWLRQHGAQPVEIDTDGIYFVPPEDTAGPALERFRERFAAALPPGIEVEFDGEYRSMFSYKMKNYALLADDGEMIVKGAALKSRGLEPFQRDFMRALLRHKLEGRDADIPALKEQYARAIAGREWPIARLAKTETLQDSPATYAAKKVRGARARNAAYELALASGREFRAGDQIAYYVTGERKSVAVHERAKLASDWDPARRDENVAYYVAKLEALYAKFMTGEPEQGDLGLQLE